MIINKFRPKPVNDPRPERVDTIVKEAGAYQVPTLEESDATYSSLVQKRAELYGRLRELTTEERALVKAIESDTSREVRPSIAELLGDEPGTKALNRKRLAEVRAEKSDHEAAIRTVEQRVRDAHTAASRAACAAVRPEFAKRVKALVAAMKTLDAAHQSFNELCQAIEAEDIKYGQLGQVKPFFLGDAADPARRIVSYIKEAEAAGYAA
ncbi:hypothetical protein [Mesorhizobium sp.]|uniref:hypothetical protein n=1 Tax=Mesorhizobium sp. TaxID=1871066 RepID=UPI000FE7D6BC|nr:hypothetical protein [Mesorhizobium sp.]RWA64405.1 MAG: hypothetical protein EOQ27_09675 [Mesorhizobium sp.]